MEKNPAAVALGKLGGRAMNDKLTQAERIYSARRAANARWAKVKTKAAEKRARKAEKLAQRQAQLAAALGQKPLPQKAVA